MAQTKKSTTENGNKKYIASKSSKLNPHSKASKGATKKELSYINAFMAVLEENGFIPNEFVKVGRMSINKILSLTQRITENRCADPSLSQIECERLLFSKRDLEKAKTRIEKIRSYIFNNKDYKKVWLEECGMTLYQIIGSEEMSFRGDGNGRLTSLIKTITNDKNLSDEDKVILMNEPIIPVNIFFVSDYNRIIDGMQSMNSCNNNWNASEFLCSCAKRYGGNALKAWNAVKSVCNSIHCKDNVGMMYATNSTIYCKRELIKKRIEEDGDYYNKDWETMSDCTREIIDGIKKGIEDKIKFCLMSGIPFEWSKDNFTKLTQSSAHQVWYSLANSLNVVLSNNKRISYAKYKELFRDMSVLVVSYFINTEKHNGYNLSKPFNAIFTRMHTTDIKYRLYDALCARTDNKYLLEALQHMKDEIQTKTK